MTPKELIIQYYTDNPYTDELAYDIAVRFNFNPHLPRIERAICVRGIKKNVLRKLKKAKNAKTSKSSKSIKNTKNFKDPDFIQKEKKSKFDTSVYENLDKGEIKIDQYFDTPRTSDEIIELHKIDTSIWKLSQYWSKEKSNGWQVSAMFTRIKETELDSENIGEILNKIFLESDFQTITIPKIVGNEKALFVYTSDKHIGAMTKSDSMYSNEYNRKVFKERLYKTYEKIAKSVDTFGAFDTIFICDLGDSVDGWNGYTTRGGHKLPQNMSNKEVFETYVEEHKIFFDSLFISKFAKNYKVVIQTNDNHGGDFSYIASKALQYYIEGKYEIEVKLMEKYLEHFEYGNHIFILTHGKDNEDRKYGLPLQLNDKTEVFINKYIDYHRLDKSKQIHLIKGDLHNESQQLSQSFRYRNVLSMYGSSKWIHNNFGPGMAGVSFDVIDKNETDVYSFYLKF
jgi:hypothetical protein